MLPTFLMATVLIIICCLFVKPTPLTLKNREDYEFDQKRTIIYSILFIASILIVFRIVPYILGTIVITIALFFLDRDSIREGKKGSPKQAENVACGSVIPRSVPANLLV